MSKTLIVGQGQQNELAQVMADVMSQALKPLVQRIEAMERQTKVNASAIESVERTTLTQKIVKAGLLSAEHARGLQFNALRELATVADERIAAAPALGNAFNTNNDEQVSAGSFLDNLVAAGGDK